MKKIAVLLALVVIFSAVAWVGFCAEERSPSDKEELAIEIHHCTTCGFRTQARSLADELFEEFGVEAKLMVGKVGSFDVYVNGELIFSKYETGRFPTPGEIIEKINEYLSRGS